LQIVIIEYFRESEQERINSSSHHINNINNKQLTKYQVPYLDVACLPSALLPAAAALMRTLDDESEGKYVSSYCWRCRMTSIWLLSS